MLDQGRCASISEMAAAERIGRGCLGSLLRLTLLAPDIVEATMEGRQPEGMPLQRWMVPFPVVGAEQPQNHSRPARQTPP